FLGDRRALGSVIEERGVFSNFFASGQLREANGRQDLLRLHLSIAKNRLAKTDILASNSDLGTDKLNEIAGIYDQATPVTSRDLINTEVDFGSVRGKERWFNVFVAFFREGI